MALSAIILCMNLTSCSDDDEDANKSDNGIVTNQKRLVEIAETDDYGTNTISFSYDSKG